MNSLRNLRLLELQASPFLSLSLYFQTPRPPTTTTTKTPQLLFQIPDNGFTSEKWSFKVRLFPLADMF
ncbi:hypothetical protein GBA52_012410 [Prunus armeniaca]|nr:hypothetical protein GBA52_012410 [Prunus armeniaca]